MAPGTLETLGYADYGPLQGPFTAHPKVDPLTGEMFFFGYNADGPLTAAMANAKWSTGVVEYWSDGCLTRPILHYSIIPTLQSFSCIAVKCFPPRAPSAGASYPWSGK